MKDILQDIVAHTHALGFPNIVKAPTVMMHRLVLIPRQKIDLLFCRLLQKLQQVELKGTFGMSNQIS